MNSTSSSTSRSTSTSTLTAKAGMTIDSAQVGPGAECVAGEEGDGLGNQQRGRFANLVRRFGDITVIVMGGIIIVITITIIITRPKPAYGRQGLAGSLGQDTDQGCSQRLPSRLWRSARI